MPEPPAPPSGGAHIPSHIGPLPTWAAVGALIAAGLVGYWLFFRNSGGGASSTAPTPTFGGTGTNPADYSASIGVLENQELQTQNAIAGVSSGITGLQTQVSGVNTGVAGVGTVLGQDYQMLQNSDAALSSQITARPGSTLNTISGQTGQ